MSEGMERGAGGPDAETWKTWLGRVQRAAVRMNAEDKVGGGDEDVLFVEGASEGMMAAVEEAFAAFEVPLTPELRALYTETMGMADPVSYVPCMPIPAVSGRMHCAQNPHLQEVGSLMDELHQWPMEDKADGDEDVVPFLVLATSLWRFLVIGPNGRFTNQTYNEGDVGPKDDAVFDLGFEEAFAQWAEARLLNWACDYAEEVWGVEVDSWRYQRYHALEEMPPLVQKAYAFLIAPMEEPMRFAALTMAPIVRKAVSDAPLVDEDGRIWERAPMRDPGEGAVVGLPFADYARVASHITVGSVLRPRPVEDNAFDDQAVEVWWDGAQGYNSWVKP